MTTHESRKYLDMYKETKEREKQAIKDARQSVRDSRGSMGRRLARGNRRGRR